MKNNNSDHSVNLYNIIDKIFNALPPQSFYTLLEITRAHLDALHLAETPLLLTLPRIAGEGWRETVQPILSFKPHFTERVLDVQQVWKHMMQEAWNFITVYLVN